MIMIALILGICLVEAIIGGVILYLLNKKFKLSKLVGNIIILLIVLVIIFSINIINI